MDDIHDNSFSEKILLLKHDCRGDEHRFPFDVIIPIKNYEDAAKEYDTYFLITVVNISPENRNKFVNHQIFHRKNRVRFLKELRDFLLKHRAYFVKTDPFLYSDFNEIVSKLIYNLNSPFLEKCKITLNELYKIRNDEYDDGEMKSMLMGIGYILHDKEINSIAIYLRNTGFADVALHKDGTSIEISTNGIIEVERGFPSFANIRNESNKDSLSNEDLLSSIIQSVDELFIKYRIENQNDLSPLNDLLLDLQERHKDNYVNRNSLIRVIQMKMTELIVLEPAKYSFLTPILSEYFPKLLE